MFLIAPGVYALTAPIWGWISDSKVKCWFTIWRRSVI